MTKNTIKIGIIIVLNYLLTILPIYSQTDSRNLKILSESVEKKDNQVKVSMNLNLDDVIVNKNDMIILTPVLRSKDAKDSLLLPPVIVTGNVRDKIINRKVKLGNEDQLPFETLPTNILKRDKNINQTVDYSTSVSFEKWMNEASLTVEKAISGCASCYETDGYQLVTQNIFPKNRLELYRLSFVQPSVQPAEPRIDRHTASFKYVVDQYTLLENYKDNQEQLNQVNQIIGDIRNNPDIEIVEFAVAGYASPEASAQHNQRLTENRAKSFADYLVNKLGIAKEKFTVEGKGEDWDGLRQFVNNSTLTDKNAVLNIIDKIKNVDARDRELKKLSNGTTYRTLLKSYYPQLRRTEYVVSYALPSFDVEEGKLIIKNNPELLTLNEMYLVANSYPQNSKEFRDVFSTVMKLYPESGIAIQNIAATDIENGNYDIAIERLNKIENNSSSWNNLGVAYMLKGETKIATEYFRKSAQSGDANAVANLQIVEN